MTSEQRIWLKAAVLTGLLAGALDITGAIVTSAFNDIDAMRVLQSVASGLLGRDAYSGGAATAMFGLLLHFLIMQVISALYVAATLRFVLVRRCPWLFGSLYGITVYFFMKSVVLPLSAFPGKPSYAVSALITGIVVHVLCVGLPIALLTARFLRSRADEQPLSA